MRRIADASELGAEQALLGAALLEGRLPGEALAVEPDDFTLDKSRGVWRLFREWADQGRTWDMITVSAELWQRGVLDDYGGPAWLATLAEAGATALLIPRYAESVVRASLDRQLASLSGLIAAGHKPDDWGDRLDTIKRRFDAPTTPPGIKAVFESAARFWQVAKLEGLTELTPPGLDAALGGLAPGELLMVGGRTAHGKSSVAVAQAVHIAVFAKRPRRVSIISLEETREQVLWRVISCLTGIPIWRFRLGSLSGSEVEDVRQWASRLEAEQRLLIRDQRDLQSAQMKSVIAMASQDDPTVVVLDHLQEIETTAKGENRATELGRALRRLKRLLLREGRAAIVTAQLKRDVDFRKGGDLQLADLMETSGAEQVATAVCLLRWPHKYDKAEPEALLECQVAKNRYGATGLVELRFEAAVNRVGAWTLKGEEHV